MFNFKYFILAGVIVLMCIGIVGASDVNDTVLDESGDDISLSTVNCSDNVVSSLDESVLGNGEYSFHDLSDKISSAPDGGVLNLSSDVYRNSDNYDSEGIVIGKNIMINGNGAIFDGNNVGRIFKITGGDVILKNITFINGNSTNGGVVYAEGNIGGLSIVDCNFSNNSASNGGAFYFSGIVNNAFFNSSFCNNQATNYGGAFYFNNMVSNVNISSVFYDNSALRGGSIYFANTARNLSFIGSNFTGNHAEDLGGAVFFSNVVNMTIVDSKFRDNTLVPSTRNFFGGALYFSNAVSRLNISDCLFITNGVIHGPNANGYGCGGGAICFRNSVEDSVINSTFKGNHFSYGSWNPNYGGALYFANRVNNVNISGLFEDNYVVQSYQSSAFGGAIGFSSSDVCNVLISGDFINNYAQGKRYSGSRAGNSYGGAVAFVGGSNISIVGSFEGNSVSNTARVSSGGAIYVNNCEFLNINAFFVSNSCTDLGGALYCTDSSFNIFDSNFINNNAGAVYITGGNMTVTDSSFLNNGIIFSNCTTSSLENSNFTCNDKFLFILPTGV